jgi:hypothetical protein
MAPAMLVVTIPALKPATHATLSGRTVRGFGQGYPVVVQPIVFRIICLSGYFFVLLVRPEFSSSNGEEPGSNSQTTNINNPPMRDGTIKRNTTHLATMNILRPDF